MQSVRPGQPGTAPRRRRRHLGTSTATISEAGAKEPDLHVGFTSVNLPDFTERVRSLLANTLLHIPSSCRLRMIAARRAELSGHCSGQREILAAGRGTLEALAGASAFGSGRKLKWPNAPRFGRNAALRIYCGEPRNTSCPTADQAREQRGSQNGHLRSCRLWSSNGRRWRLSQGYHWA